MLQGQIAFYLNHNLKNNFTAKLFLGKIIISSLRNNLIGKMGFFMQILCFSLISKKKRLSSKVLMFFFLKARQFIANCTGLFVLCFTIQRNLFTFKKYPLFSLLSRSYLFHYLLNLNTVNT